MTPLDLAKAEIARLHGKIAALESDVRFYKREREIERAHAICWTVASRLHIRPQVAWLLAALHGAGDRGLTRNFVLANMPGETHDGLERNARTIDVAACVIRRRLGADSLGTVWGVGYALLPKGRELLERVLEGDLDDLPAQRGPLARREQRKLSDTAVRVMRNATEPNCVPALAAAYNCSIGLVYAVRAGTYYQDVDP